MFRLSTPVEPVSTEFLRSGGVQVYLKRDDLIHPFVSGNKWRKLKYNIESVLQGMYTGVVTFGGAYSNHLIATACACASAGIPCIGLVRGDELNPTSNYVLRLCHEFGMELKFVSRQAYRDKEALAEDFSTRGYWVVPEGGANEEGVKGCEEILPEGNENWDHVVVAVGTATTFAGIIRSAEEQTVVHGIAALKGADYLMEMVSSYTDKTNWRLHTNYAQGGFGKFDNDLLAFNKQFASETGVLLDPVYTGKMMWALYNLIKRGEIGVGQKVLCIHTGGMTGVLNADWLKSSV